MITRWIQTEKEQEELGLVHAFGSYWMDKHGKFWFNDETQADVCGPFDTLHECKMEAKKYADSL